MSLLQRLLPRPVLLLDFRSQCVNCILKLCNFALQVVNLLLSSLKVRLTDHIRVIAHDLDLRLQSLLLAHGGHVALLERRELHCAVLGLFAPLLTALLGELQPLLRRHELLALALQPRSQGPDVGVPVLKDRIGFLHAPPQLIGVLLGLLQLILQQPDLLLCSATIQTELNLLVLQREHLLLQALRLRQAALHGTVHLRKPRLDFFSASPLQLLQIRGLPLQLLGQLLDGGVRGAELSGLQFVLPLQLPDIGLHVVHHLRL
mmetsp:Transcript_51948/g.86560  ORF Transcript_51948/g.86560 Transcript_51948/m.86560 type:complete len:261 (-) Transcript_51948:1150-1932(-)